MAREPKQTPELPDHLLPVVAVVGRPNVGKSTLFNRLTGTRRAAVYDTPGVTRDRNYGTAEWGGRRFRLIDTGGFESDLTKMPLLQEMREQALIAIQEADIVVLLADVNEPDNPTDHELIQLLRKGGKPMLVGVNKCEKQQQILDAYEFGKLGVKNIYPMSALHGNGNAELLDDLLEMLPPEQEPPEWWEPDAWEDDWGEDEEANADRWARRQKILDTRPIQLAIIGRQNVGKSTLVNQLLGQERVIASDVAGTTRDSIDTPFQALDRDWILVDTAGIRRRGKVGQGIEGLAAMSSLFSMERADVSVLLLDATEKLTAQDKHIAGFAVDKGCCLVIGLNKWDLLEKDDKLAERKIKELHDEMPFLTYVPVITLSAKTGQRAQKIVQASLQVFKEASRRIDTSELNEWLEKAINYFSPPIRQNRKLTIKYATQSGVLPPTFQLFCNDPKLAHFSYQRYLTNSLREAFDLHQVPIRLKLRKKSQRRKKGR
jgi:GTP-binding protein